MECTGKPNGFDTEVVIIGAGAAGLAAADHLQKAGISTCVYEAKSKISGRIRTIRHWIGQRKSRPLEQGAEFIHWEPDSSRLWRKLLKENELKTQEISGTGETIIGKEFFHDMRDRAPRSNGLLDRLREEIELHFQSGGKDMDLKLFIKRNSEALRLTRDERELLYGLLANEYGSDPSELSLRVPFEPDSYILRNYRIADGYESITNALSKGIDIRLNTAITNVRWSTGNVIVSGPGAMAHAGKCLTTVPLGMMQQGIPGFDPLIPAEKYTAMNAMNNGRLVKVFMEFRERFWNANASFIRGGKSQLAWPPFIKDAKDHPFLTALIGGRHAGQLADINGGEAAREVALEIMRAYGVRHPRGMFKNGSIISWHDEPWIHTGYSSLKPGSDPSVRETLRAPVDNTLYFAGEATSAKFPATVTGAMDTGIQAAQEIIDDLRRTA